MSENDDSTGGAVRRLAPVVGVFVLLTAVLTLPLSLEPATRAMALSADTRLFLWTLSWDVHALLHQPLRLFDANIFHPEPRTLAYSEHVVGSAIVGAPFLVASGNPVLALNVVVLLSCVLSGAGTFFLARELGISRGGAFAAGVIFAFAPPRFTRLAQLHLATVQWIPFCLAFVHRYLRAYHRRDLIAAIFFFTLQSITSGHGGLFLLLALLALGLYLIARRSFPPLRTLARDVGIVGVLLLALNLPFALPYFRVQREQGLRRTIGAVYDWVPNAASFLASPSYVDQALVSLVPPVARAVADAKAYMFPGWLTLLLLAALLLPRRREGEGAPRPAGDLGFYAVLAGLSLWASLGPPFGLYALLYHALPGFDLIRVPSRLAILTELALALLAGAGASRLLDRLRPPLRGWAGAVLVLLLAAEFATPLNAPRLPDRDGRGRPLARRAAEAVRRGRAAGRAAHGRRRLGPLPVALHAALDAALAADRERLQRLRTAAPRDAVRPAHALSRRGQRARARDSRRQLRRDASRRLRRGALREGGRRRAGPVPDAADRCPRRAGRTRVLGALREAEGSALTGMAEDDSHDGALTSQRLDVWLDVACLFKTRSLAQAACRGGKVEVNGQAAPPNRLLRKGDELRISRGGGRRQTVVVRDFAEHHVAKVMARALYEDRTPPPTPEELELLRLRRAFGVRAPSGPVGTRERRAVRRLKERG